MAVDQALTDASATRAGWFRLPSPCRSPRSGVGRGRTSGGRPPADGAIAPGEIFTCRFQIEQRGTCWYHPHSGMQEITDIYGKFGQTAELAKADGTRTSGTPWVAGVRFWSWESIPSYHPHHNHRRQPLTMKKTILFLLLSLAPAVALAAGSHPGGHGAHGGKQMGAVGQAGKASDVKRTVEVSMNDSMRFVPDKLTVKAGETVRFVMKNVGKVPHEMVIGSMAELKEHAELMRKFPGMEHEEPNMITLKPGQRGGLIWKFDQPGSVDFACLVPGHMEAGMVGKVTVSK